MKNKLILILNALGIFLNIFFINYLGTLGSEAEGASGVFVIVVIIPIIIIQVFLIIKTFLFKNKYEKPINTYLFISILMLSLSSMWGVPSFNQTNNSSEYSQLQNFLNNGIPPIENGTWYYPDNNNLIIELNFKNGKSHGEHIQFDPQLKTLVRKEFYEAGKLDSIYRYSENQITEKIFFPKLNEEKDSSNTAGATSAK